MALGGQKRKLIITKEKVRVKRLVIVVGYKNQMGQPYKIDKFALYDRLLSLAKERFKRANIYRLK